MKIKDKQKFRRSILITIAILLIVIILVAMLIKNMNKKYNTIEDFGSVKEVLEYLGCTYIRTENSKDEDYKKNVLVKFNKDLYEDEISNERFFNNLVQMVTRVNEYKSIMLTDTERNIIIKIKCDEDKKTFLTYYINDIENYFAKQDSNNSISNFQEEDNTKISVNSNILKKAINSKWVTNDINFGSKDSEFEDYNIYFDEGIKVRTVTNKVFNIVFDKNYKEDIVNNIKVGTSLEDIKDKLGTPTYEDSSNNVIGYRNSNIYIFFTEEEVSVYRVENLYNEKFYQLVEKFVNSEIDFQEFVNQLTTLWPDYDAYANTEEYYMLTYALNGVKIAVTPENKDGIHLYSNYLGLKQNEDIQKFIDSGKVHVDTKTNLVFENEKQRLSASKDLEYSYINYMNNMEQDKPTSNLFYYRVYKYDDGSIYKVGFLSKDNKNTNNELKDNINSYIWYDDSIFLYGKTRDGIYAYDVINRESMKLIDGQDNFEIKGIEENKLKYDNKSVELKK